MKLRFLPAAGVLVVASLAVTACNSTQTSALPAATGTSQSSAQTAAAPATTATAAAPGATATAPATAKTAPVTTAAATGAGTPAASAPSTQDQFASALAAWKRAAAAPMAVMNTYFAQAATDLKQADYPGYDKAASELTYLAGLPVTNVPQAQQAQAHADTQDLDAFFGTPGLLS